MTTYFEQAAGVVKEVQGEITSAVDARFSEAVDMMNDADVAMRELVSSSAQLSRLSLDVPPAPNLTANVDASFDYSVDATSFGSITSGVGDVDGPGDYSPGKGTATEPAYNPLPSLGNEPGNAPEFTPPDDPGEAPEPQLGNAPVWRPPTEPRAPELLEIMQPDPLELAFPPAPQLAELPDVALEFPEIPPYDGDKPTPLELFIDPAVTIKKNGTDYAVNYEGRAAGFYGLLSGMSEAQARALFEKAAATEDRVVQREVNEAVTDFSSRGFTMPPGALAKRTDAIRSEGSLRKLAAQREVIAKSIDINAENARHALGQAVDAENKLATLSNEIIKRDIDMQVSIASMGIQRYNTIVSVYNANQAMYATQAAIYKAKVDGLSAVIQAKKAEVDVVIAKGQLEEQKAKIYAETVRAEGTKAEAYKAQISAIAAIAQTNEAMIKSYTAELQVITTKADVYKAEIQGYQAKAEVEKVKIDAFRSKVDAYVALVQGEKAKIEGYVASVQGYSARANALQAVAGSNLAMAQAYAAEVNADVRREEIQVAAIEGQTKVAMFKLDKAKTQIMVEGENIRAAATAFEAHARAAEAAAKVEIEGERINLAAQEANMRTAIAIYDTSSKNAIADMERMVRAAQLQAESGKVVAQTKATMAAGLMAGVHYSLGVSGQAGINGSGASSYTESHNYEE